MIKISFQEFPGNLYLFKVRFAHSHASVRGVNIFPDTPEIALPAG